MYSGARTDRVVHPPLLAQRLADLAHRAARTQRLAHRWEQVRLAPRGLADVPDRGGRVLPIPLGPHPCRPLELALLRGRVDVQELDPLAGILLERVDSDDDALACLDLLLVLERGSLDLLLDEAGLDRRDGPARLVDAPDQLPRARLQLVGQRLDVVRAAERIGGVDRACLGG